MKILSVIIPCYNSQDYMRRCINSLLAGNETVAKVIGEAVEIIIVNDGSVDGTADIAQEYHRKHPKIVKVVNQENKGHGGAINAGLQEATGVFVKVVDSDDWVDAAAYKQVLKTLINFKADARPDVVITNYVYEKTGKRRKTTVSYGNVLPQGRLFTWKETRHFRVGQYLLMHALIYRRDILLNCGLRLPEHTFYVDNIYAYTPLACTQTLYYLNVNLYRYYIGREGQSVQEATMMRRIGQQLAVNRLMVEAVDLRAVPCDKKRRYLAHYLEIVTAISSLLLIKEGSRISQMKKDELWRFVKKKDAMLYDIMRNGLLGRILHLRGITGRYAAILVYKISRMIVGFS